MKNPFDPFAPLEGDAETLAAPRNILVERINLAIQSDVLRTAILVGPVGVGKTTLLRIHVANFLRERNYKPVYLTCTPNLNAYQLLSHVALGLGFEPENALASLGINDSSSKIQQQIGNIEEGDGITIVQVSNSQQIPIDEAHMDSSKIPSILDALAKKSSKNIVILLDQLEQIFLGEKTTSSLYLLESLFQSSMLLSARIAVVMAVRAEALYRILPLNNSFPLLTGRIFTVSGLSKNEAMDFISNASSQYGASFSSGLLNVLTSRLAEIDGTVWPVALHATCRPLAEISKTKRRTVTKKDMESLGDLSKIVGQYVEQSIRGVDPYAFEDIFLCLYTCAENCHYTGFADFSTLARVLAVYSATEVHRMLQILVGLRILEERNDSFKLVHDSLEFAIRDLGGTKKEISDKLTNAVNLWASQDLFPNHVEADGILAALNSQDLPAPYLVFVGVFLFYCGLEKIDLWFEKLSKLISNKDDKQLVKVIYEHVAKHGRVGSLSPGEMFLLLMAGKADTISPAIQGMISTAKGSGIIWRENLYNEALQLSRVSSIHQQIPIDNLEDIPLPAARVFLRFLIDSDEYLSEIVLKKLWTHSPDSLKPDILIIASRRSKKIAAKLCEECMKSEYSYLRAAAFDVISVLPNSVAHKITSNGVKDESAIVRRRAVYSLGDFHSTEAKELIKKTFAVDSSPFVREGCIEVASHSGDNSFANMIVDALQDEFDFVRESAVYAAGHLLDKDRSIKLAQKSLKDSAPKVREAAMRILSEFHADVEWQSLVGDLRAGPLSTRTAAAELISFSTKKDFTELMVELLSNRSNDREIIMTTLKLAAEHPRPEYVGYLADFISSPDEEIVCAAIYALQTIALPECAPMISSNAFHPSADVRERTVYALGELGGPVAVDALIACVHDPLSTIKSRAIYALGRLNVTKALQAVSLVTITTKELEDAVSYYKKRIKQQK